MYLYTRANPPLWLCFHFQDTPHSSAINTMPLFLTDIFSSLG